MKILPATEEHLPRIREIYNEAVLGRMSTCDLEPRTLEDRRQWFKQFGPRHPIFVGLVEGEVAAYGALFPYSPKEGYRHTCENSVYVDSRYHRRGLGRLMLTHLITAARACDMHYIEAKIFRHNEVSLRLHAKLGFETVGIHREIARLDGEWRDSVILGLVLS